MTFEVLILGCGAATPTSKHNPSSQLVNIHDKLFLVDCGEGTQMQLRRNKVKFQRIQHIFISHLHGDHYLGLLGLISSMHLLGRKSTLHLYGPKELKELVELNLRVSQTFLDYPLVYHETSESQLTRLFEDKTLEVFSFPLKHRIPCTGFLFKEKQKQHKVLKDIIVEFRLSPSQIIQLKKGNDVETEKGNLKVETACVLAEAPKSYAYCSDTMYWERLKDFISGVDLIYHESTFLNSEKERAKQTYHSTAEQAAKMASLLQSKRLILGHYSSRYTDLEPFLEESKPFFENVQLADEGMIIHV